MPPRPWPPYSSRPADAHPPVRSHLLDDAVVRRAVPVGAHLVAVVRAGQAGEVGACVLLERALLDGQLGVLSRGLGDRHVGEGRRTAQVADDVANRCEVAGHRVGLVDAHAAVKVLADLHHARGPVGEPVRSDGQVVGRRVAGVETTGGLSGRQRERPRPDVHVRDLLGDGLELRERASELAPVPDVAGGEITGSFDDACSEGGQAGDGVAAHHVGVEHAERRRGRERVGGLGCAARRPGVGAAHTRAGGIDDRDRRASIGRRRRDEQQGRPVEDRHTDLGAADTLTVVRRRRAGRQRRTGLAERGCEQQLAGQQLRDQVGLQRLRTRPHQRQQTAGQGLPHRKLDRAATHLVHQDGNLGQAQILAAVLLRSGQRQQPGLLQGAPGPVTAVEHVADDGAHLVEHRVHADLLLRVACYPPKL